LRWTLRLFGKKVTDSPVIRRRLNFTSGRYFGINIRRSFGS
jgi:hypothetical protein